jgi:hypothetical protein
MGKTTVSIKSNGNDVVLSRTSGKTTHMKYPLRFSKDSMQEAMKWITNRAIRAGKELKHITLGDRILVPELGVMIFINTNQYNEEGFTVIEPEETETFVIL